MIFYKKRDFGELISDTLEFFRVYGKNYFKNYFAINGGILILLLIFSVVGFKDIVGQVFSSNLGGESYYFEEYFDQNAGMLIAVSIIIFILLFTLSIVSYSFPILYMDAVAKTKQKSFTINEMLSMLKDKAGRMIIFAIASLFIITPLIFLALGISIALIFLIIGFFLIIALIPISVIIINFTLFDFLTTKNQYFDSLGSAFRYTFSNRFWKYLGVIIIIYFIIQAIVGFFTMVPAFIMGVSDLMIYSNEESKSLIIIAVVFYMLGILASFILSNAVYILSGFMYYDSREDLQRETHFDEIDSIGKHV